VPERARIQSVSKGRSKNGTGPGIFAITRAKLSGDCRITRYNATQETTQSAAITQTMATAAFLTDLDFVFKRTPKTKWADYRWCRKEINN